ncbi:MAG: hypothetical protein COA79_10080 [Planctomycetota bacterium]|nr:MAG: hypothetical protein COA79_10080 [Planctomycetota bacterium]
MSEEQINEEKKSADELKAAYWRENLIIVGVLLFFWFAISFGCSIIFVDQLNTIRIGGYKLGFWFGQQGSIIGFVFIIFIYTRLMNKLDKKYGFEEAE